jgi:hypothetical protein
LRHDLAPSHRCARATGAFSSEITVDQGGWNDPKLVRSHPDSVKNTQQKIKIKNHFHFIIKYFINTLLSIG